LRTGLRINNQVVLRDACDAVYYCSVECSVRVLGCAVDCRVRKYFGLPPHGNKWPVCSCRSEIEGLK